MAFGCQHMTCMIFFMSSIFYSVRIIEQLRLETISGGHLVHLKLVARTMSRWLLKISKKGGSITSLGNLCQCSFTVKKCFQVFGGNLLFFSLCPLPVIGHHWKEPSSVFFIPSFRYKYTLMTFPSWVLSEWVPASYERCSRPLIIFETLHWTLSSSSTSTSEPRTQHSTPGVTLPMLNRGGRFLSLSATLFLM